MTGLRLGLEDARAGRGRLFLLTGEPGIGKTRVAEEFAGYAAANGARVAWGRCWEGGGAPAYWPWVQVLRSCLRNTDRERLDELAGPGAHDVEQLLPEFRQRPAADMPGPHSLGAEQARFRLFESVSTLLRNYARAEPLVLVLDDLHDADQPSLLMLQFVARELVTARIVIVGTYREVEVQRSPTLAQLLGTVLREGRQIQLSGLGDAEIARLVRASAGLTPSERLVAALRQTTSGNPLFIEGVVRLIVAEGRADALTRPYTPNLRLPEGVREAIRRQLGSLSADARSVLASAAAIGNEFELDSLEQVSGLPRERLLDLVAEAVAAAIVMPSDARAYYRFAHALIRNALYDGLAPSARMRLHAKIAEVLEHKFASDLDSHLAELAHHFAQVAEPHASHKAIDYSIRAGDAANAVFAYEEAVAHFKTALDLMGRSGAPPARRAELMARLGEVAGITDRALGVEYLEGALRLYESLGNVEAAAEMHSRLGSALSLVSSVWNIPLALEHFRKAEAVLSKGPESASLGRLYVGIAAVAEQVVDVARGIAASARAMEIGKRVGDELIWVQAAVQHATYLLRSGRISESCALFDKAWENADRLNEGAMAAWLGGYARLALRDPLGAQPWYRRELAKPRMGQAPFLRLIVEGSLAIACAVAGEPREAADLASRSPSRLVQGYVLFNAAGDWESAESILTEGLNDSLRTDSRDELFNYRFILAWVFWARQHYDRAEKMLEEAVRICPDGRHQVWDMTARPDLAMFCVRVGKLPHAVEHLVRCREIISAGEDWRGSRGAMARAEAVLASAEQRNNEAQVNFADAVAIFRRYHLPNEEVITLIEWSRSLSAAGDHDAAVEKCDIALEICRHFGANNPWAVLVSGERARAETKRSEREKVGRESRAQASAKEPPDSKHEAMLCREGDFWTVAYAGRIARIKDIKGISYLARLLRYPGHEFHSLDLVAGGEQDAGDGSEDKSTQALALMNNAELAAEGIHLGGAGDAGEMLSPAAKADYKRRRDELREELDEAKELGDVERANKAQDEIDALTRELARAVGLHGRDRRAASASERARLNVTRSIKAAIERIGENHPELGALLVRTIKTGTFCSYVPDAPFRVEWKL